MTGWRDANELKIEEDVQNMAASVSMVSGDRLEAQNLEQLSDYAAYLPGLNLDLTGVPGDVLVQLRGIAANTNNSALVYYIDDTPIGSTDTHAHVYRERIWISYRTIWNASKCNAGHRERSAARTPRPA